MPFLRGHPTRRLDRRMKHRDTKAQRCVSYSFYGHAHKVCRVVRASGPLPSRDLWIRTQRSRAIDHAIRAMRRDDLAWRDAFLHPLFERAERGVGVRPRPSAAMPHAWRQEETEELLSLLNT